MAGEWEAPVAKLSSEIEDLRETIRTLNESKDRLRPELGLLTAELSELLNAPRAQYESLYEFPRVLSSILTNPRIGALVFGPDGKRLLFNSRAEELLGELLKEDFLTSANEKFGFFSTKRERLSEDQLPWSLSRLKDGETELLIRRPTVDNEIWLRVVCNVMKTSEGGADNQIGGVVVFLADITEHIQVLSQLTNICTEMEGRLTKMKTSVGNLEALTAKLSRIRMSDLEIESSARQQKTGAEPTRPTQAKASGLRLLVVDDVAVNQKLLKIQLVKMGFAVDVANDGQQAFDAVRAQNYACVLMDCDMPKVDGYEATAMIRSLGGDKGKVPIIAVTAYDREGDKQKCLDCGMNDYVTKGSHEEDLRETLGKWIGFDFNEDGDPLTLARSVLQESRPGDDSLDFATLDQLYGSEAEDILKLFMGVTSTYIECLDLALTSKDVDAVNHFAFSIKGPCASLKLGKLAKLASELPLLSAKHKWREARRVYNELKGLYEPLYLELKEKMGGA